MGNIIQFREAVSGTSAPQPDIDEQILPLDQVIKHIIRDACNEVGTYPKLIISADSKDLFRMSGRYHPYPQTKIIEYGDFEDTISEDALRKYIDEFFTNLKFNTSNHRELAYGQLFIHRARTWLSGLNLKKRKMFHYTEMKITGMDQTPHVFLVFPFEKKEVSILAFTDPNSDEPSHLET